LTTNFLWLSRAKNWTVSPMVFKITSLHLPHSKRRLPLLRIRDYSFCCLALGVARTTLKTIHVIVISPVHFFADCCLATSYKRSSCCWLRLNEKVFIAPLSSYTYILQY
jgi:hypothetical protein